PLRDPLTMEASWLLRPVLRHVRNEPQLTHFVSRRLGVDNLDLTPGAKLRLPRPVVFELLEDLARQAGMCELGLQSIGRRAPETLLDYVVLTAATLGDALVTLARMNRLNNDAPFDLEIGEQRVILRQHFDTDQARQFGEGACATVVNLFRTGLSPDW